MNTEKEKALLVYTAKDHGEIYELARAAGYEPQIFAQQNIDAPTKKYYLGSGKVNELKEEIEKEGIEVVIFDTDLTPMQVRNLEEAFDASVADRTDIILRIFLSRAATAQSRLQVQNAVLKRSKNRLTRKNINFSRQGGGMQNKGSGETQLELDRRNIATQIANNEKELKKLEKQRSVQRAGRKKSNLPLVSLAGYTNAGKSTILNGLVKSEGKAVLEKDALFATLDPSTRLIERPLGRSYLLTDTVGFISHLPHDLVQGFKTTLEEITLSDLVLQVMDLSNPDYENQKEVVEKTLEEIGATNIAKLLVNNKCDETDAPYPTKGKNTLHISAKQEASLELLSSTIEEKLFGPIVEKVLFIPWHDRLYADLFKDTRILEKEETEDGIRVRVQVSSHLLSKYAGKVQE